MEKLKIKVCIRQVMRKNLFSDNTDNILQNIFGREKKIK